jgi:YggT family protein
MISIIVQVISLFSQVFTLIVLAHVILSYFLDRYHPVRVFIDRLVEPLLYQIRKVVPLVGMFDFSPVILIILVQFIASVVINILIGR